MNCYEIDNRLPAYLEGLLSPEENGKIAEHLASCAQCGRALADLKKTQAIVHGLDEVEPPPFFEQRIMARVREEAWQKKGFLRKLFYPLHIKVPIQALATILVAVLAFHIYQSNEPEMKQAVPLPLPVTEQAKDRVAAELPPTKVAPPAAAPIERRPAAILSAKKEQGFAVPPSQSSGMEKGITASAAPVPKEPPAVAESAAPPVARTEKEETYSVGSQTVSKAREGTAKQDAGHALDSSPPERKQKMMAADAGATVGESRKAVYAPSSSKAAVGSADSIEARIVLKGPMLVGFFPPVTKEELDDEKSGFAEGIAHVEFALADTLKCLRASEISVTVEFVRAHSIVIEEGGRKRIHKLSAEDSKAVGVYLLKPGAPDYPVYAEAGPSSLLVTVPIAAGKYFHAAECK